MDGKVGELDTPVKVASAAAPELSVVIPTFNERANVAVLVDRLVRVLHGTSWEIIFVDDNSPDGTFALAKDLGTKDARVRCIRRIGRRGLAGACIEGMLSSQARYVAVMDGDLQHDEKLLTEMLMILRVDAADIVIGSRYLGQSNSTGLSKRRSAASRTAGRLANAILGTNTSDPLSGFFMIRRDILEDIAPHLSTQGFKVLLDILASAGGTMRVRDLPYDFQARHSGASKLDGQVILDFLGLLVAKAAGDAVPLRFVSFLVVGASGIFVHLIALKATLAVGGLSFPLAQTAATWIAMTSNFYLNNSFTYRDQRLTGAAAVKGLVLFYVICAMGAVSNIGVASWFYANQPVWWLAGLIGSLISAVWNYALSSAVVWNPRR